VLRKDGEDQLDRSCKGWSSTQRKGIYYIKYIRGKTNWIGYILRRNVFLKHIIEGKTEGRTEVTGREGRICKQLLDCFKEKRRY
jgi:hypothetical protein